MTADHENLKNRIDDGWTHMQSADASVDPALIEAVEKAIGLLDAGAVRIVDPDNDWSVNEWLKKAVLLWFRLQADMHIDGGPGGACWWDRVPSKFSGWDKQDFVRAGLRAVPPCAVRRGAYVAPGAVLMPCYVNIGAYVGAKSMIDTWATVGSCAQIGSGVHISGGAGIGGVLEPVQSRPVIIEDDCFIGARAEVAEGVIVRQGAVLAMGVFLSQSTRIVDRASGRIYFGEIPPYSVVVPGSMPASGDGAPSLSCAVIVKQVDAKTRAKTAINELLRY